MDEIYFYKYQATGNDFIIIDLKENKFGSINPVKLCDRHFGIGADGILLLSHLENSIFQMKIINSDGSFAEMCGNGIRCLAKYIKDKGYIGNSDSVKIQTDAGLKVCYFNDNNLITVNMGKPFFVKTEESGIKVKDKTFNFFEVSMGNPHAVIFVDNPEFYAKNYGFYISENRTVFKNRTNVEFISINPEKFEVNAFVYERGCGITMSCGTGASAIGALLTEKSIFPTDKWIKIKLPGGTLFIKIKQDSGEILLKGASSFVFKGSFNKEDFV